MARHKKYYFLAFLVFTSLLTFSSAYASECAGVETSVISCDNGSNGIYDILSVIVNIFTALVGVAGVIGFVVSGVQYSSSAGNEVKMTKAKRRMIEVTIGLTLYIIMYGAIRFLSPVNAEIADIAVESVTVQPVNASIYIGEYQRLSAYVQPFNASDSSVTWVSSSPNVASVDKSGRALGRSVGTAIITATTKNGLSSTMTLIVTEKPAPEVTRDTDGWSATSSRSGTDQTLDYSYNTELPEGIVLGSSIKDATWKNGNECDGKTIYPGKRYVLDEDTRWLFAAMVARENCSSSRSDEVGCKLVASQIINLYEEDVFYKREVASHGLAYWLTHSQWYASNVKGTSRGNRPLERSEAHTLARAVTKHVVEDGNRYLPLFVNRFDGAYHWIYDDPEYKKSFAQDINIFKAVPMVTRVKDGSYFWCIEGKSEFDEVFDYKEYYRKALGM